MPDSSFELDHAALLMLDLQRSSLHAVSNQDTMLARAADAIAAARTRGVPVVHVRLAFTDADMVAVPPTSPMAPAVSSSGRTMHVDSEATQFAHQVAPKRADLVIRKTRVGPFATTELDEHLRARKVTTLLLAGLTTSGVVLSTVCEAVDRDYQTVVLGDLTADPNPRAQELLLSTRFFGRATVTDSDHLLGLLNARPRITSK